MPRLDLKIKTAAMLCFPGNSDPVNALRKAFFAYADAGGRSGTDKLVSRSTFHHWISGRTKKISEENGRALTNVISDIIEKDLPDNIFELLLDEICDLLGGSRETLLEIAQNDEETLKSAAVGSQRAIQDSYRNQMRNKLEGYFYMYRRHSYRVNAVVIDFLHLKKGPDNGMQYAIHTDGIVREGICHYNEENMYIELRKKNSDREYIIIRINQEYDYMVGIRLAVTDGSERFPAACKFIMKRCTDIGISEVYERHTDLVYLKKEYRDKDEITVSYRTKVKRHIKPEYNNGDLIDKIHKSVANDAPNIGKSDSILMVSEQYVMEILFRDGNPFENDDPKIPKSNPDENGVKSQSSQGTVGP